MGTPHVRCMSHLPTAHEPPDERLEDGERGGGRDLLSSVTSAGLDVTPRDPRASCQ
jgi:hypothetical protein